MPSVLLPQTAEYALRAMACVAAHDGPVRAADLAAAAQVPPAYLQKVLRKLVVAGLLDARKGVGGGFRLARPAADIRFSDVLRAADFDLLDDHCAFGYARCGAGAPCPLHGAYSDLKRAFAAWADTQTLADFSRP